MNGLAEAVALGFGSGPVCVAACGPVLLPFLGAEARKLGPTGRLLAIFLGGRLAGYLGFAVVAWAAGLTLPPELRTRTMVFGLANFGLAAVLGFSVFFPRRACVQSQDGEPARLYQIGTANRFRPPAALTLGFLTGLNLCPPFIAAGVRAAATHSLTGALAFFALFFAGTSVWFLPALGVSWLRRFGAVPAVARMTMAALSIYYAYLGVVSVTAWRMASVRADRLFTFICGMVFHA